MERKSYFEVVYQTEASETDSKASMSYTPTKALLVFKPTVRSWLGIAERLIIVGMLLGYMYYFWLHQAEAPGLTLGLIWIFAGILVIYIARVYPPIIRFLHNPSTRTITFDFQTQHLRLFQRAIPFTDIRGVLLQHVISRSIGEHPSAQFYALLVTHDPIREDTPHYYIDKYDAKAPRDRFVDEKGKQQDRAYLSIPARHRESMPYNTYFSHRIKKLMPLALEFHQHCELLLNRPLEFMVEDKSLRDENTLVYHPKIRS